MDEEPNYEDSDEESLSLDIEKGSSDDEELGEEEEKETEEETEYMIWEEPPSDEEENAENTYDVDAAWQTLFNLPSVQHVMIPVPIQLRMDLEVGVNVTQEYPWRQVKYKYMDEILFSELDDDSEALREAFRGFGEENYVLVGYAPLLTQNDEDLPPGDPFIFFINTDDVKKAMTIIKNIESYEHWRMEKRLVKRPKDWEPQDPDRELIRGARALRDADVEIQSVYPIKIPMKKELTWRKCKDVRDGYVELVPSELVKFEIVQRRRVNMGIQVGSARQTTAQQTDPTYPTNVWVQYHYEINENENYLDVSSEDESKKDTSKSKPTTPGTPGEPPPVKPPPKLSAQVQLLLKTLEFNQIDMYRNDYPLISSEKIEHYSNPYLQETLCFADIELSHGRYVVGSDWYPRQSGMIAVSYAYSTPATIELAADNIDPVKRAVLDPNPVLLWSFNDNLNYKLIFEAPQEITVLSFCPFNYNILIGGASNGQLLMWDLLDRAEHLDNEEILNAAQTRYRLLMEDYLSWTKQINEEVIIRLASATALEVSHKAAVTGIFWMGKRYYMNNYGQSFKHPDPNAVHRYFMTSSKDGRMTFWSLDHLAESKTAGMNVTRKDRPKILIQAESDYKNKCLKPVFSLQYTEPITSLIGDFAILRTVVTAPHKKRVNPNYRTKLAVEDRENLRQTLILSTIYGHVAKVNWTGGMTLEADSCERVQTREYFAAVHDGPVVMIRQNSFYPQIFLTIGRTVFALWMEDYTESPIFWRTRECDLTAVAWSESRPSVFFLGRIDGYFEVWDIMARDDDAVLSDVLAGGIMTAIIEHRPKEPEKFLGIGDYNSSFRFVKLPPSFYEPIPDELELLKQYVARELERKKTLKEWEKKYNLKYSDEIAARIKEEQDEIKGEERQQKETALAAARKAKEQEEELRSAKPTLPYPERMKRQWEELNLKRVMSILMSRQQVDEEKLARETVLEKERLAYEACKKQAIKNVLKRAAEELEQVRLRIMPLEIEDLEKEQLMEATTERILQDSDSYEEVEAFCKNAIRNAPKFREVNIIESFDRARKRRDLVNKSMGGNTERHLYYEMVQNEGLLDDFDCGADQFLLEESSSIKITESERHMPSEVYVDEDEDADADIYADED